MSKLTIQERNILDKNYPEFHFVQYVLDLGHYVEIAADGESLLHSNDYEEIRGMVYNLDELWINVTDKSNQERLGSCYFVRYNNGDDNWVDYYVNYEITDEFNKERNEWQDDREYQLSYRAYYDESRLNKNTKKRFE